MRSTGRWYRAANLGAPVLIVDMSGTTFCDSAGVQAIIAAHKQAAGTDTPASAGGPRRDAHTHALGVGQLVPLYPTLEAALTGAPAAEPGPPEAGGY
jgi:anti-sigma B factor antagonist